MVARVQGAPGNNVASLAFPGTVTAGNFLVCNIHTLNSFTQVSDTFNGQWTLAVKSTHATGVSSSIWYKANTVGAAPGTMFVTCNVSGTFRITIEEFNGMLPTAAHYATSGANGIGLGWNSSPATVVGSTLAIGGYSSNTAGNVPLDSPWISPEGENPTRERLGYIINPIVAPLSFGGTQSSAGAEWAATVALFTVGVASDTTPPTYDPPGPTRTEVTPTTATFVATATDTVSATVTHYMATYVGGTVLTAPQIKADVQAGSGTNMIAGSHRTATVASGVQFVPNATFDLIPQTLYQQGFTVEDSALNLTVAVNLTFTTIASHNIPNVRSQAVNRSAFH
jgi:hypothetical protein